MLFFDKWPNMASTRLSAALMRASAGVIVGMVRYLWQKNTVSEMRVHLVELMYTLWHL